MLNPGRNHWCKAEHHEVTRGLITKYFFILSWVPLQVTTAIIGAGVSNHPRLSLRGLCDDFQPRVAQTTFERSSGTEHRGFPPVCRIVANAVCLNHVASEVFVSGKVVKMYYKKVSSVRKPVLGERRVAGPQDHSPLLRFVGNKDLTHSSFHL